MQILVLNCGSSSIKSAVIDTDTGQRRADVRLEGIAEPTTVLRVDGETTSLPSCESYDTALELLLNALAGHLEDIDAVGHRVVHGGEQFVRPVRIDEAVCEAIRSLVPLAPLHNDACLKGILAAMARLPALPHVAVFDTTFHATLPQRAAAYAVPSGLAKSGGIRRFGFHGISHEYVAHEAADFVGEPLQQLRIITCH